MPMPFHVYDRTHDAAADFLRYGRRKAVSSRSREDDALTLALSSSEPRSLLKADNELFVRASFNDCSAGAHRLIEGGRLHGRRRKIPSLNPGSRAWRISPDSRNESFSVYTRLRRASLWEKSTREKVTGKLPAEAEATLRPHGESDSRDATRRSPPTTFKIMSTPFPCVNSFTDLGRRRDSRSIHSTKERSFCFPTSLLDLTVPQTLEMLWKRGHNASALGRQPPLTAVKCVAGREEKTVNGEVFKPVTDTPRGTLRLGMICIWCISGSLVFSLLAEASRFQPGAFASFLPISFSHTEILI